MNESQEAPRCSYRAFPVDSNCAKARLILGGPHRQHAIVWRCVCRKGRPIA
jgi:hypothetical protein